MPLRFSLHLLLIAFLMLAGSGADALARERIADYQVAISVNKDRSVDITETIEVYVEGEQIKRGLLRDIPETYRREDGRYVNINPQVSTVRRDGQDEPYQISHEGRYFRLRIGDANILLQHGLHTYEISYSVEDSIGFFDDYDEIYWNAIGTEWAFPIERARVTVQLPQGASVLQYSAYTGRYGEGGNSLHGHGSIRSVYQSGSNAPICPRRGYGRCRCLAKGCNYRAKPKRTGRGCLSR